MNRGVIAFLIVAAAVALLVFTSSRRRSRELIPWTKDYTSAQTTSHRTGKPLLIDFWAEWCGPCQEMRRTTWADPTVAKALENYVVLQVNVDDHPDLARQFGVQAIPHLALVRPDGQVIRSSEGMLSSEELINWLHQKV